MRRMPQVTMPAMAMRTVAPRTIQPPHAKCGRKMRMSTRKARRERTNVGRQRMRRARR